MKGSSCIQHVKRAAPGITPKVQIQPNLEKLLKNLLVKQNLEAVVVVILVFEVCVRINCLSPVNGICSAVIVWRIRGKIIRTAEWCIGYHSCTQSLCYCYHII